MTKRRKTFNVSKINVMNGFIAITRFPTSTYYILVQDMPKECGFIHEAVWETGAGFP